MKKIFFSAIAFLFFSAAASAQTNSSGQSARTNSGGGASRSAQSNKKSSSSKPGTARLNQRKTYHWTDGQRATPTGDQATSSNGNSFMSGKKDTAHVKHLLP